MPDVDHQHIRIAALYRFSRLDDPAALKPPLDALCRDQDVRGTILLAREGVNGTIAGTAAAVEAVLRHLRALPGCADLDVKDSWAASMPFARMKVRLKREIVTMGVPGIDPLADAGTYVAPGEWNALIDDPAVAVIDTRNAYEVSLGTFAGAIDPGTRSFGEFPAWFRANRDTLLAGRRTVAMFCTGGIRCEKATAFLKAEGVADVRHLHGGILRYLETIPAADSRWDGECFVFDQRVTVVHGLAPGVRRLCPSCQCPPGKNDHCPDCRTPPADGLTD